MDNNGGTPSSDQIKQENQTNSGQPWKEMRLPQLVWDIGTAYDFFISLTILHEPEEFGLRASWAAGVRSRLSSQDRKALLDAERVCASPITWVYHLPAPKNATSAIWELKQLPAEKRLSHLTQYNESSRKIIRVFQEIADRGSWEESDLEAVKQINREINKPKHTKSDKVWSKKLDTWANAGDFGERYLTALESYYQVFFAEEEKRLEPILRDELEKAKDLSTQLELPILLEQLFQGLHFEQAIKEERIILAPSFWGSPLVFFDELSPSEMIFTFGARPADASIVPGEVVPDALLRSLKAVSDPTRLRILRFLACDPMTPADLARKLRLRAPTVTHHLRSLRLAGLVHLSLEMHSEGRYTARLEAVKELYSNLYNFLNCE